MSSYKKNDKIEITWTDAQSIDGWHNKDYKLPDDCVCTTVGYFVSFNEMLTVCQSISPDEYGNFWQVPKNMIINIKKLK